MSTTADPITEMEAHEHVEDNPHDDFPTPLLLAQAICRRLAETVHEPLRIVEPSANDGVFLACARETWPGARLIAVELQPKYEAALRERADGVLIGDWLAFAQLIAERGGANLILGNPPYKPAEAHIRAALRALPPGGVLALLLRINFVAGIERALGLWQEFPPSDVHPIAQRPSFRKNKKGKRSSDMTEYGLYVWVHPQPGEPWPEHTRLHTKRSLVWRERGRRT